MSMSRAHTYHNARMEIRESPSPCSTSLIRGPSCFWHALFSKLAGLQFSGDLPSPSSSAGAWYLPLHPALTWIHRVKLWLGSHCKSGPLLSHLTGPHPFWPNRPKSRLTESGFLAISTHTFYAKFILSVNLAAAVASAYDIIIVPSTQMWQSKTSLESAKCSCREISHLWSETTGVVMLFVGLIPLRKQKRLWNSYSAR
jgi:hypothetical protein